MQHSPDGDWEREHPLATGRWLQYWVAAWHGMKRSFHGIPVLVNIEVQKKNARPGNGLPAVTVVFTFSIVTQLLFWSSCKSKFSSAIWLPK